MTRCSRLSAFMVQRAPADGLSGTAPYMNIRHRKRFDIERRAPAATMPLMMRCGQFAVEKQMSPGASNALHRHLVGGRGAWLTKTDMVAAEGACGLVPAAFLE